MARKIGNYPKYERSAATKRRKVVPEFNKLNGWYKDKLIVGGGNGISDENWERAFPGGTTKYNCMWAE
jgi:hypothetical protein